MVQVFPKLFDKNLTRKFFRFLICYNTAVRIWDVDASILCRVHLLGEHRELHALWNILTENKKGYSSHPETKRWIGKLKALYLRHEEEVSEMEKRGYRHLSPLDKEKASGSSVQDEYINTIDEQKALLKQKPCSC